MEPVKTPTQPVGSVWEIGGDESRLVVRPDGVEVTVTGGLYVLTQPGTHRCGDQEMEATR
jgi:hypothetical protein